MLLTMFIGIIGPLLGRLIVRVIERILERHGLLSSLESAQTKDELLDVLRHAKHLALRDGTRNFLGHVIDAIELLDSSPGKARMHLFTSIDSIGEMVDD